jgi:hypothetical protein
MGRVYGEACPIRLVGEEGLEPSASASRTLRATKLRHSPAVITWLPAAGPPAGLIVASGAGRAQCGGGGAGRRRMRPEVLPADSPRATM